MKREPITPQVCPALSILKEETRVRSRGGLGKGSAVSMWAKTAYIGGGGGCELRDSSKRVKTGRKKKLGLLRGLTYIYTPSDSHGLFTYSTLLGRAANSGRKLTGRYKRDCYRCYCVDFGGGPVLALYCSCWSWGSVPRFCIFCELSSS